MSRLGLTTGLQTALLLDSRQDVRRDVLGFLVEAGIHLDDLDAQVVEMLDEIRKRQPTQPNLRGIPFAVWAIRHAIRTPVQRHDTCRNIAVKRGMRPIGRTGCVTVLARIPMDVIVRVG